MRYQTLSSLMLTLFFALPVAAKAGPISSGGGKGIACRENGGERIYLADTFDLVRAGQIRGLEDADDSAVIAAAVSYLDSIHPEKIFPHPFLEGERVSLGWMVAHASANLPLKYNNDIPELDDDHIDPASLPRNCRKLQLAVQDFDRNVVEVKSTLSSELTHFEYGMLRLHETFLNLRGRPGDTTPIRRAVARVLEDPRLDFRQLVKSLLEIREKTNNDWIPKSSPEDEFLRKNCWRDIDPSSDLYAQCRAAQKAVDAAWKEADARSAVPTLLRVPEVLYCHVTSENNADIDWQPPASFEVVRVQGDGRPEGKSRYELDFGSEQGLKPDNSGIADHSMLWTDRHRRQFGFSAFGSLRISMSWLTPEKTFLDIILHDYIERTGELRGVIQLVEAKNRNTVDSRYTSYGISCFSPHIEFGIDMTGSH